MQRFDYSDPLDLLTPSIVRKVAAIHELKGKQALYIRTQPQLLEKLCTSAKIRSAAASNRIEGISTSQQRLGAIMAERTEPQNRDEQEIAGYRDVLALIHENYEFIPITPNVILQLHDMLYRHSGFGFAGKWKDSDNSIIELDAEGNECVRFKPTPTVAVPSSMEDICASYTHALLAEALDPLILIARFVFDFVSIHPFIDGNGRMSRLLMLLLLYRSGFLVGRYVSIEDEIDRTRDSYYEALAASSAGWESGDNDYAPFVEYLLGVILAVYQDFDRKVEGMLLGSRSKAERVEEVVANSLGTVSKAAIAEECPDISVTTIERTLKDLLDAGKVRKVGGGRSTAYALVDLEPDDHQLRQSLIQGYQDYLDGNVIDAKTAEAQILDSKGWS